MQKKYLFFLLLFFIPYNSIFPQLKIGYVDSDAVLEKLPDAQDARQQLDALIQEWQDELNKLQNEWKTKYDDYEKRKLIMSDQTRVQTEQELVKLEQEIADYRQKKFGTEGELFQKQDELMKPVQNRVFNAITEVAQEENYDYILDRSGGVLILFAKEQYDITNLVLQKLNEQQ
ncbi:MAG: hypothetical protein STSR0008_19050 [Ignavibacterium sp.]